MWVWPQAPVVMRATPTVLVAFVVALAAVVAAPAAALGVSMHDGTTTPAEDVDAASTAANNDSGNLSAGQQLSAVVGVGGAEVESEVEARAFGLQLRNASTDEERAAVLGNKSGDLRGELSEVREEMDQLRQARENGTISESEYRAEVAPLATRAAALERQVNTTANASEGLPADVLEANGVNASSIEELRNSARNLSGGEVAEIARSIGGPDTGTPVRAGPPGEVPGGNETDRGGDRGGPDGDETDRGGDAGGTNETDGTDRGGDGTDGENATVENATERVETARDRVAAAEENVTEGGAGSEALADATAALDRAETALADARNASGDARMDHAGDALAEAATAIDRAQTAIDRAQAAGDGGGSGTGGGSGAGDGTDAGGA